MVKALAMATSAFDQPYRGGFVGAQHHFALSVYFEDTDTAGIVYYANYLKFAERGRTEMMRELGFAHSEIAKEIGTLFTVRRCSIDYRAPARLDDALTVDTRVVEIGGATLLLDQQIRRDEQILVQIDMLVACVGREGRARRVPAGLRAALITLPS
jgi:acyl-CoA thioester hydrolase